MKLNILLMDKISKSMKLKINSLRKKRNGTTLNMLMSLKKTIKTTSRLSMFSNDSDDECFAAGQKVEGVEAQGNEESESDSGDEDDMDYDKLPSAELLLSICNKTNGEDEKMLDFFSLKLNGGL